MSGKDFVGPLAGTRVLEFGHYVAGPYCTQILAGQGADVIKIEYPGGDQSRKTRPIYRGRSTHFQTLNRGKRSIVLDLKSPDSRRPLVALIESADALVTNLAPDAPSRLGIAYDDVKKINPKLVYTQITGFGLDGPYSGRPAVDGIIQSMSGLAHLTGEPDGPPMTTGLLIPDHVTAVYAALATTLGLHHRQLTGNGSFNEISMLDCMLSFLGYRMSEVRQLSRSPKRAGNRIPLTFAGVFEAKDGYVYLAPLRVHMWERFARAMQEPRLLEYCSSTTEDVRLKHRAELDAMVEAWTRSRSVQEITTLMTEHDVPCSPVQSIEDIVNDPHVRARGMVRDIKFGEDPGDVISVPGSALPTWNDVYDRVVPDIGEHTAEILQELGL